MPASCDQLRSEAADLLRAARASGVSIELRGEGGVAVAYESGERPTELVECLRACKVQVVQLLHLPPAQRELNTSYWAPRMLSLSPGHAGATYTEAWRALTEAMQVLSMPADAAQRYLGGVEDRRGATARKQLIQDMQQLEGCDLDL